VNPTTRVSTAVAGAGGGAGYLYLNRADVTPRALGAGQGALVGGDPGRAVGLTGSDRDRIDQLAARLR
jgi:hypothetical protein